MATFRSTCGLVMATSWLGLGQGKYGAGFSLRLLPCIISHRQRDTYAVGGRCVLAQS